MYFVQQHCQQKDGLDYAAWSRPRGAMAIKQGYEVRIVAVVAVVAIVVVAIIV